MKKFKAKYEDRKGRGEGGEGGDDYKGDEEPDDDKRS